MCIFFTKQILKGEDILNLQIWDIDGSETYHLITTGFYHKAEACD